MHSSYIQTNALRRPRDVHRRWSTRIAKLLTISMFVSVFAPVGPASADSFGPTEDSYVDNSRPTRNYGRRSQLRVDSSPLRTAYLKFSVQGAGPQTSAVLKVFAETSGDDLVLYEVADTTWQETTLTAANAPVVGAMIDTVGPISGANMYAFDVSSVVTGDGVYSFAVRSTGTTTIRLSSSEGQNSPQLLVPAPPSPSPFQVTINLDSTYTATSLTDGSSFVGSLKSVVESAVSELNQRGGGEVQFVAGTFDFGAEHLELSGIADISFVGQGIGSTMLVNDASTADDTEIFDVVGGDRLRIADMTVRAGGSFRSTSDALDFDDGNNIIVERVRVEASRGRGIVFDGKGGGWTASNNVIRDCEIDGVPSDGIELLSADDNVIEGCTISNVGGHGIQLTKASATADQPNKPSDSNQIRDNTVDQSGADGININSSNCNVVSGNTVTNSADLTANRDGIRILSTNLMSCDANEMYENRSTDDQPVRTQRYGLNISSALCVGTIIGSGSDFSGNRLADINDLGSGTEYPADTTPPTVPNSVSAFAASAYRVQVDWTASTDDVDVVEYGIYRDDVLLETVVGSETSFIDNTVVPSTLYSYTVDAADVAGNRSAQSAPPAEATTPLASSEVTLTPTADGYVSASSPSSNYGSSSKLRVDGSPDIRSYVSFDVPDLGTPIVSATLRIYGNTNGPDGLIANASGGALWTESGLTYVNAPSVGAVLGSGSPVSSGGYLDIDVTGSVRRASTFDVVLSTPGARAISLGSRESSNPPLLVVTT